LKPLKIVTHTEYILEQSARPIAGLALIATVLLSLYTFKQQTLVFLYMVYTIGVGFICPATAGGYLADEIVTGRAQLYIAAGLRRMEYYASWWLALVAFPALATMLSMVLPLLVVNPHVLLEPPHGSLPLSIRQQSHLGLALLFSLASAQAGVASYTFTVYIRKRNAAILSAMFYLVLAPLLAATLLGTMGVVPGSRGAVAAILAAFNVLIGAGVGGAGDYSYIVASALAMILLSSLAAAARVRRLEL